VPGEGEWERLRDPWIEAMVESLPFAVFALDTSERYVLQNAACRRQWGDALGKRLDELDVPPDDARLWKRNNRRAFAGEVVSGEVTLTVRGVRRHFHNVIAPVRVDGGIRGIIGVNIDIDARKKLENRIRQADKMHAIGTMAGGISHDFSNILHAILGYSTLIKDATSQDGVVNEYAVEIDRLAHSASDLAHKLLTLGRGTPGSPRAMDVNALLGEHEDILARILGRNIRLSLDLDPRLWAIEADPSQIEQVVVNLAVNARDAMPGGGTLTFRTRNVSLDDAACRALPGTAPGPHVLVTVADTGEGMDAETLERIFDPFFTTKEPGQGTGLGLSVVYGIVEQHGGHVGVSSEPGRGTSVHMHLPASPTIRVPQAERRSTRPDRGNGTVLLVDDETSILKVGRLSLEDHGYAVLTARDGEEALAVYRRRRGDIDVVILDIVMPRMDGIACLEALEAEDPNVKVILASGYPQGGRIGTARPPTRTFLQKPYDTDELLEAIRDVLDGGSGGT
jgi:PAS domain S-box-containing protein